MSESLLDICKRHRPTKQPHFLEVYDEVFARHRQAARAVLEIGIGNGNCLRMWRDYFPAAAIYGIEIRFEGCFEDERITVFCGKQEDTSFLDGVAKHGPFDVIIDDASHYIEHQRITFHYLFPHLCPGGMYAIEDLHTSYWPKFGGGRCADSTMEMLCGLVHGLNYSYWKDTENISELASIFRQHNAGPTDYIDAEPTFFDLNVGSVHFFESLCIVTRRV